MNSSLQESWQQHLEGPSAPLPGKAERRQQHRKEEPWPLPLTSATNDGSESDQSPFDYMNKLKNLLNDEAKAISLLSELNVCEMKMLLKKVSGCTTVRDLLSICELKRVLKKAMRSGPHLIWDGSEDEGDGSGASCGPWGVQGGYEVPYWAEEVKVAGMEINSKFIPSGRTHSCRRSNSLPRRPIT